VGGACSGDFLPGNYTQLFRALDEWFAWADMALYQGKEQGRNRVMG